MASKTQNLLSMNRVRYLKSDIELLASKVDDYYLKYGELPTLCYYANKSTLEAYLYNKANSKGLTLNNELSAKDGDDYVVIELEKLDGLTLNFGYDANGQYQKLKEKNSSQASNPLEDELYVINTKTHQIYFPHGVYAEGRMYYTF